MSLVSGVDFAVVWVRDFDAAIELYGTTLGLHHGYAPRTT